MRYYDFYDSPHGRMLLVASGEGLTGVYFDGQKSHPQLEADWRWDPNHAILQPGEARAGRIFCGRAQALRYATGAGRDALSARGLACDRDRQARRDHHLWRAGEPVRISRQLARRRCRHRPQPADHHRAVPSHRGLGRQSDRLRRRTGKKARAAGARRCAGRIADSQPVAIYRTLTVITASPRRTRRAQSKAQESLTAEGAKGT